MPDSEVSTALNRVIGICRDGIEFYEEAEGKIDHPDIRDLFRNMAQIRKDTIAELTPYIEVRDETVTETGTLGGATHRLLADIHARLSIDETKAFVAQLESAEGRTVQELQEIVGLRDLPDPIADVLHQKVEVFQSTFNQMRTLRQAITD